MKENGEARWKLGVQGGRSNVNCESRLWLSTTGNGRATGKEKRFNVTMPIDSGNCCIISTIDGLVCPRCWATSRQFSPEKTVNYLCSTVTTLSLQQPTGHYSQKTMDYSPWKWTIVKWNGGQEANNIICQETNVIQRNGIDTVQN